VDCSELNAEIVTPETTTENIQTTKNLTAPAIAFFSQNGTESDPGPMHMSITESPSHEVMGHFDVNGQPVLSRNVTGTSTSLSTRQDSLKNDHDSL
jgi:hypothetical protein